MTGGGVLVGVDLPVRSEGVDGLHVQSGASARRHFLVLGFFFFLEYKKIRRCSFLINEKRSRHKFIDYY